MIKFVGRDGDLNRVKEALRTNHCISVVGVGGVGKTRLVKELIRNEGNAIFVSLESVQSLVLSDLLNTTIQELKSKTKKELLKTILILDNAEHVITPLRDQIGQFLDLGCRVLITSREPLKHPEEFVLRLLPFDRAQTEVFFRTLLTQQNLALESELDSFNYQAIYAWLDGLPLALEIVAQKLSVLSYKEQNTFLEKQLFPQHPRSSEKAERHRTLNHAFEWSWASLAPASQHLLSRCSLFSSPFSRAALLNICDLEDSVVDSALSDLMQKSLVRRESDGGEVRFRMLYAIRTHASAKLTKEESVKLMNKIALFLVQELFATTKLLRDGRKFWLPLKQLYNDPTLNPSVTAKLYRALQSLETTVLDSSFRNKFDRSILTSKVEPLDADYISLDIAQSNGDWDTFDREFDKFIKVHKDLTNAMIVDVLWMINRFRTESLDQIDALKKRLVGTDDHCLSFWIQEATYRARNGMHDQAEALFERAQEYAEGYSKEMETMVLIGRGFIALRENRLEEANYFLGKVDPDSAPPTSTGHHIGVLRRLGKNREALKIAKPFFEDVYELGNFYTATTVGWDLYLLTGSSTWLRRAHDICVDDGVSTCCLFYIGLSELKSDPKQALRTFKKAQRIAINGAQRGTAFAFQSLAGTPKWKELEQEWMGTALENEIPTAQKVAALNDGDSEQVDFFLERRSKRSRTENHEQNITYTIHLGFDLGDACAAMLRLHVCIRRSTICENLAYETSSKPPKTGIESTQMFRSNWFESSIRRVELCESRTKRTDLISDAIPFLLLEESIFI